MRQLSSSVAHSTRGRNTKMLTGRTTPSSKGQCRSDSLTRNNIPEIVAVVLRAISNPLPATPIPVLNLSNASDQSLPTNSANAGQQSQATNVSGANPPMRLVPIHQAKLLCTFEEQQY